MNALEYIQITILITSMLLIIFACLIWRTSRKIDDDQYQLQQLMISNQQQFQYNLNNNHLRTMLYRHRIECYLQVTEAFSSDVNLLVFKAIESNLTHSEFISAFSKARSLLLSAFKKSEMLFDTEVSSEIKKVYDEYCRMQNAIERLLLTDFITALDHFLSDRKNMTKTMLMVKFIHEYSAMDQDNPNLQPMFKHYPDLKQYLESQRELEKHSRSSPLKKMLLSYIDVRGLGKVPSHSPAILHQERQPITAA